MARRTIPFEQFVAELKGQGVSAREHAAFRCPICRTVQSIASLIRAGASANHAESAIGFSCEGRLTKAGPAAAPTDTSPQAAARRQVRGCDWSLGGLLHLHELEVTRDGKSHPHFELASPEEAQALEASAKTAEAA